MERLTSKGLKLAVENGCTNKAIIEDTAIYNKLYEYEDIEEELGISLVVLFKALENGIYGRIGNKIEHILAPHFSFAYKEIYIYKIKDYGKTWALTKEELEK